MKKYLWHAIALKMAILLTACVTDKAVCADVRLETDIQYAYANVQDSVPFVPATEQQAVDRAVQYGFGESCGHRCWDCSNTGCGGKQDCPFDSCLINCSDGKHPVCCYGCSGDNVPDESCFDRCSHCTDNSCNPPNCHCPFTECVENCSKSGHNHPICCVGCCEGQPCPPHED